MSEAISVVQIDELNLDKECISLPTNILKYANRLADAKRDVDEAKNSLEVVKADLAKEIRDTPGKFGLEKVTEGSIKEIILTNPRCQKAAQALRDAEHHADLAGAVLSALNIKKSALSNLVELHGMGYFSNPKISERGREAVDDIRKRKVRLGRRED